MLFRRARNLFARQEASRGFASRQPTAGEFGAPEDRAGWIPGSFPRVGPGRLDRLALESFSHCPQLSTGLRQGVMPEIRKRPPRAQRLTTHAERLRA